MTLIRLSELRLLEQYDLAKSQKDVQARETWKDSLIERCLENEDKLEDLILNITDKELNSSLDIELSFTAWSDNFVYFPAMYNGDYWVASAPRNPCDKKVEPIGGG